MEKNEDIKFDTAPEDKDSNELSMNDFRVSNYLKNPEKDASLVLKIIKVEKSDKTIGKNKETGKEFNIGLSQKDGKVVRYDITTEDGIYTINNWEIYFKLFGSSGLLMKYARAHNGSFAGAVIKITRLIDARYSSYKPEDLMMITKSSKKDAEKMIADIKLAVKEQRLFNISLEE